MKPKTIVILVFVTFFAIILIQNWKAVPLQLLPFWEVAVSGAILILTTMVIGFILGYLVAKVTSGSHGKQGKK